MSSSPHHQVLRSLGIGVASLVVAILASIGGNTPPAGASDFRDTSPNAIINGGALTATELVQKARQNAPGDLQTIFSEYGLSPSEYNRFEKTARTGTAYKDGRIVVDGRVVATNAKSLGRSKKSYSHEKTIGGITYHESYSKDVFLSDTISALVMFNDKGQMEFAILRACANPITGTRNNPVYKCNALTPHKVNDTTYDFTAKASASNGASLAYGIIDYGDGTKSGKISAADLKAGTKKFRHVYNKTAKFTAKLTVYVSVPGNQTYTIAPAGTCLQTVSATVPKPKVEPKPEPKPKPIVLQPVYSCDKLIMTPVKGTDDTYMYSVQYTALRGATLIGASYTYGDGSGKESPKKPTGSLSHTYKKNGTFTSTVRLTFSMPDGKTKTVTSNQCKAVVTLKPVYACTLLKATSINDAKASFRFTALHTERRATLKSALFTLDGKQKSTVKPNKNGKVFIEYTFKDDKKHTVLATLSYNIGSTTKTVKCSANATATLPPQCPIAGKENYAPDSPECFAPCPLNPVIPVGDVDCAPPAAPTTPSTPDLPTTGPGHVAVMFTTLAAFGAATHFFLRRRGQRLADLATAAVTAENPAALQSFIAKTHPNHDEVVLAQHEFQHLHPEQSSRTSRHRLIQKAVRRPKNRP